MIAIANNETYQYLVVILDKNGEIQEWTKVKAFKMIKAINDHVRIYLEAELPNTVSTDIAKVNAHTGISIKLRSSSSLTKALDQDNSSTAAETLLFQGVVTKMELAAANDVFTVKVEGASATVALDRKLQYRSFQQTTMTYKALIEKVLADYNAVCRNSAERTEKIGGFFIQYARTDWQHLIRMASQLQTGLVADCLSDRPAFWFGVPERSQHELSALQAVEYQIGKELNSYRQITRNQYLTGVQEKDFCQVRISKIDRSFEIGDRVTFQNHSWYVSQATAELVGSALRYSYLLVPKDGLKQPLLFNDPVKGIAVDGQVIQVVKDQVKVHLIGLADEQAETPTEAELYAFPFATFYAAGEQTGWYAMPETGDTVKLNFPGNQEKDAYLTVAVRQNHLSASTPTAKCFGSYYEKVLLLGEEGIELLAYGKGSENEQPVVVRLNTVATGAEAGAGIEIKSYQNVNVIAGKNLVMNAGNTATLTAGDSINIKCQASRIILDGAIELQGNPVKLD